jgi:hypothetical protein
LSAKETEYHALKGSDEWIGHIFIPFDVIGEDINCHIGWHFSIKVAFLPPFLRNAGMGSFDRRILSHPLAMTHLNTQSALTVNWSLSD